jgi:hypothetical protein
MTKQPRRKGICFHGTKEEFVGAIRSLGFVNGTYFARALEDAIEFGGHQVFEVEFDDPPSNWQFRCKGVVPPERIVSYTLYGVEKIYDDPDRRQAICDHNAAYDKARVT